MTPSSPLALRFLAALLGAGWALALPAAGQALELRGSTYFTRAPWKADLRTFNSNVWAAGVEHFLTIDLEPTAGASLARLSLRQIRGADPDFITRLTEARAFVGRPRQEGAPLPVTVAFDGSEGLLWLAFPEPVPPGTTVTVALRAWRNPFVSDTYLFQVVAWPAGPDPVASPVGVATLRIYDPLLWR